MREAVVLAWPWWSPRSDPWSAARSTPPSSRPRPCRSPRCGGSPLHGGRLRRVDVVWSGRRDCDRTRLGAQGSGDDGRRRLARRSVHRRRHGSGAIHVGRAATFDGIGFMPVAIGMVGLADIIHALASPNHRSDVSTSILRIRAQPGGLQRAALSTARGTLLGSILGVLPGGGPLIASFASYTIERKVASAGPPVGSGAIEGVAGRDSQNAAAPTSFIPCSRGGCPPTPSWRCCGAP